MEIRNFKRRLGLWSERHKFLGGIMRKINFIMCHWSERQHDKTFGALNPSLKFYVIRSSGPLEGLLSMYMGALRKIYLSLQNGFIPIVDYENYKTQYNISSPVNGTHNAWEYYFEQPCTFSLDEVYQSRNVRFSGWTLCPPPPSN